MRDAFPTTVFPLQLTNKQIKKICEIFDEAQCGVINENNFKEEQQMYEDKIKRRVLKSKKSK